MPDADPESFARTIVLDLLTRQARTRKELTTKLVTKGVPDDVAARVLDRMEEVGLVDDGSFARQWVRDRHAGRGLARGVLAQELRRKGIDDEVAREALRQIDGDDELETALELARRRAARQQGLDRLTLARRLTGHLARKGYGPATVSRVVREVVGELAGSE